jgi:secreted trypsin-like serine protease
VTDESGVVAPASAIQVAVGINNLTNISASNRIPLKSIKVIPEWNPVSFQWDFALLELDNPSNQPTTPLIAPGQEALIAGGSPGKVAGWGCTSQTGGECNPGGYPNDLIEADVNFVSDALCGGVTSYGEDFDPNSMICAGNFDTGTPDT